MVRGAQDGLDNHTVLLRRPCLTFTHATHHMSEQRVPDGPQCCNTKNNV